MQMKLNSNDINSYKYKLPNVVGPVLAIPINHSTYILTARVSRCETTRLKNKIKSKGNRIRKESLSHNII
jgi:hypothetical protein